MGVSLSKQVTPGKKVNLSKEFPTTKRFLIGLGWDLNKYDGDSYDLDAMGFILDANDKVLSDHHFVFYRSEIENEKGQKCDPQKCLVHTGDNRTGEGDGDDEQLILDTTLVDVNAQKVVIAVNIYDEKGTGVTFGQVENAFIRVADYDTGVELLRTDLSEDHDDKTSLVFAEIYKHNNDWKYKAVCQGYNEGLAPLCRSYGVNVE